MSSWRSRWSVQWSWCGLRPRTAQQRAFREEPEKKKIKRVKIMVLHNHNRRRIAVELKNTCSDSILQLIDKFCFEKKKSSKVRKCDDCMLLIGQQLLKRKKNCKIMRDRYREKFISLITFLSILMQWTYCFHRYSDFLKLGGERLASALRYTQLINCLLQLASDFIIVRLQFLQ